MKVQMPPKEQLEADYLRVKSCDTLAEMYGCGHSTVHNWLKRYGIPIIPMKGRKLSEEHRQKVIATLEHGAMAGKKHSAETRALMSEARKGSGNANYKGGKTEMIRKFRRTKEYIHWRDAVVSRAGGRCEKCGKRARLEAHHIISLHKDMSKGLDLDNGEALCHECHLIADGKEVEND